MGRAACAGEDGRIVVWDATSDQELRSLAGRPTTRLALALTMDGNSPAIGHEGAAALLTRRRFLP